ncbi:MAG: serine/threonine protein kinase, partial [Planctomycetota bacterium]
MEDSSFRSGGEIARGAGVLPAHSSSSLTMATTSSKATFLQRLEQSRLLDNEQLARAAELVADADAPQSIARSLVREGLLSEWQAAQLLQGRTQFHLGKYKLIRVLGTGGMGTVYLAEHVTMNRRVAVKSVSSRLSRNPDALKQFLDEARTIAALDHPNIVHAYSVDEVDGRYFLVMEYVAGKDLATIVEEQGPFSFVAAVDLVCQAADGLAYAHEKGV